MTDKAGSGREHRYLLVYPVIFASLTTKNIGWPCGRVLGVRLNLLGAYNHQNIKVYDASGRKTSDVPLELWKISTIKYRVAHEMSYHFIIPLKL